MAKKRVKKEIKQPVIVKAGTCGEFEVTYRLFAGDEGPAAEFFGFVNGERVKILRFDDFEKDPHYHYNPDTPQDKKYSFDPVMGYDLEDLKSTMYFLPKMVRAAGYKKLARRMQQLTQLHRAELSCAIQETTEAMDALRRQEKRKAKKAAKAKG
ncbi:hypothetical protein HYZ64_00465 [Candidatus Berkelbacteria bacterium]|nr:hypothetical protein [Candidatus Berkelbacteria bacterium]